MSGSNSVLDKWDFSAAIGALIVLAVLIVWVLVDTGRSLTYYLTISELRAQGASPRRIRVSGIALGESIRWHPETGDLVLEIVNGEEERLAVH